MTIAIKTCGVTGQKVQKLLQENREGKEFIFVDSKASKWGTKVNNIPVVSIYKLAELYRKEEIEEIIIPDKFFDEAFVKELISIGIEEDIIRVFSIEKFDTNQAYLLKPNSYTYLRYLEFHVCDHCNLNCRGCGHFSPLVNGEEFTDLEQFSKDINRLKELILHIKVIRIMGGEPLLNSNLDKFIIETRKAYPYSDIYLLTNGLLLHTISEDLWACLRENNVTIEISVYPVAYEKADSYMALIQKHGVKLSNMFLVDEFFAMLHSKQEYPYDNVVECSCRNLKDGKIAACPLPLYGKYYNEYFGENLPFETGQIDIYNNDLTGPELMKKLNEPFEMCSYCHSWLSHKNRKKSTNGDWAYRKKGEAQKEDWYAQ